MFRSDITDAVREVPLPRYARIEFMDGQTLAGELVQPFHPSHQEIELRADGQLAAETHALKGVACIWMKVGSRPRVDTEKQEVVETYAGQRHFVVPLEKQRYQSGFFAVSTHTSDNYVLAFFTSDGVKSRCQQRPLGEILAEKGLLTESQLEDTLNRQDKLKKKRIGEIISKKHAVSQIIIDRTAERQRSEGVSAEKTVNGKRQRIGAILVEAGLVRKDQLDEALASQQNGRRKKIGEILIDQEIIDEETLLSALATKFNLQHLDLSTATPTQEALNVLAEDLVRRFQVLPLELEGNRLVVVTSDPTDAAMNDAVRFHANMHVRMVVSSGRQIHAAIEQYYGRTEAQVEKLIGDMAQEDVELEESAEETENDSGLHESDSQVIRLVNNILIDAYKQGASDIHFEVPPGKAPCRVRYRIDGVCHAAHKVPVGYKIPLISRLKIISGLDIAERRRPQSGKIMFRFEGRRVEFRVEITPTCNNLEDAVLRILSSSKPLSLDEMGFNAVNRDRFADMLTTPYGLILCVGPTGSGKTTTLHSALARLNTPGRKIWTAEDPIEITQDGLRQVQVNPKIGFTFQAALRSFLRADPDVVMIGEMRDIETAKTAIEASLTGHLVFSTLHTNSAPETAVRLVEMGVDAFNFADAMVGILAQRLARRLCPACRVAHHPARDTFDELVGAYGPEWFERHGLPGWTEETTLMRPGGCERCGDTGFKGRLAVHELLAGWPEVKRAVKANQPVDEIAALALQKGMRSLRMDGLQKVLAGHTTEAEIMKVCV